MVHFEGRGILNESDRQHHARLALVAYTQMTPKQPGA